MLKEHMTQLKPKKPNLHFINRSDQSVGCVLINQQKRVPFSGMWCHIVWKKFTSASEHQGQRVSHKQVTICLLSTCLAYSSVLKTESTFLQNVSELLLEYNVTSQRTVLIIGTAVRTSDSIQSIISRNLNTQHCFNCMRCVQKVSNLPFSRVNQWSAGGSLRWRCGGDIHAQSLAVGLWVRTCSECSSDFSKV
jgi:hypothetical protein